MYSVDMCKGLGLARSIGIAWALSGLSCTCTQPQNMPQTWLKTQASRATDPLHLLVTKIISTMLVTNNQYVTHCSKSQKRHSTATAPTELGRGEAPDQHTTDFPSVLEFQQIFKHKFFLNCCMLLVNFQNAAMVAVSISSSFTDVLGGKDLLTSLFSHTWKSCQ